MIDGFRHAAVVVRDMRRALKFYRDILGLKVQKVITLKGKHLETLFNKKRIVLRYAKLYAPGQDKTESPIFVSRPLHSPITHTKLCFGYDPDGNLIEFIEDL